MQIRTVGEIRQAIKGLTDDHKVTSYDGQGISMYVDDPRREKWFEQFSEEEKANYPTLVIDIGN